MKNKLTLIVFIWLIPSLLSAQFVSDQMTGKQYQIVAMSEYEGSQFLFVDWKSSTVIIDSGVIFKGVPLLFDVYNKLLYFKKNEATFLFNNPVKQFEFLSDENKADSKMKFRIFNLEDGKNKTVEYVQVLAEGKYHLLKTFDKTIDEIYEYNNPVKLKVFRDVNTYMIISNKETYLIGNIAKDAQSILSKLKPSFSDYIKEFGKLKTQEDLIKAMNFINE